MARERRPPEVQRVFNHINSARRLVIKAVERASNVDLRPGHIAEARRRAAAIRDEAQSLVEQLGG